MHAAAGRWKDIQARAAARCSSYTIGFSFLLWLDVMITYRGVYANDRAVHSGHVMCTAWLAPLCTEPSNAFLDGKDRPLLLLYVL